MDYENRTVKRTALRIFRTNLIFLSVKASNLKLPFEKIQRVQVSSFPLSRTNAIYYFVQLGILANKQPMAYSMHYSSTVQHALN